MVFYDIFYIFEQINKTRVVFFIRSDNIFVFFFLAF
jgi:hypothetical protein